MTVFGITNGKRTAAYESSLSDQLESRLKIDDCTAESVSVPDTADRKPVKGKRSATADTNLAGS
jgi:hypothetical protein